MSRCQRCDSEDAHPVRLFGDFRASLCVDCVNLYTVTLTQSSLWARQQAVEAEELYLEHAARSRTLAPFERYCELAAKRLQIQKDAIDLAAAFVAPITPAIADEAAEFPGTGYSRHPCSICGSKDIETTPPPFAHVDMADFACTCRNCGHKFWPFADAKPEWPVPGTTEDAEFGEGKAGAPA